MNNVDVESLPSSTISIDELDKLLNKYFETIEVQNKRKEEQQKLEIEQNLTTETTTTEFNDQLIQKLDDISRNTQFSNNIFYTFGILSFVIVATVVFYKFLKVFI